MGRKEVEFPFKVRCGSVTVRIYHTPSHGCDSFTLSYYQDGVRKRPTFPTFEKAREEAEVVGRRLTRTNADVLTLTSADRAAYLRARELLDPLGVSLEVAAAQFAEARKALGQTSLHEAVGFYVSRHPRALTPKPVKAVVEEMMESKRGDGLSEGYLRHLEYDLTKFSSAFATNIASVSGQDIDQWLRNLGVAPRTRNNLRASVKT